jgi:single-strand DNA-binding protein
MNLNKIFLIGRVTKQPEKRTMPSGSAITTFSIATNRVWKDKDVQKKEETEFSNCTAFGKTAETISTYVVKGQEIMVEGRIHTSQWLGKDGTKKYSTGIIVESFQFGQKPAGVRTEKVETPKINNEDIPVVEEPEPGEVPEL